MAEARIGTVPRTTPRWPAIYLAIALLVLAAACSSSAPSPAGTTVAGSGSAPTAAPATTLKVLMPQAIPNFDPSTNVESSWPIHRQLFDTLFRLDENREPQARLAESWELAPDQSAITLTLRDGIKFSDGTAIVADDIAREVARQQDPETGALTRSLVSAIKEVTVKDERVVTFDFGAPFPGLLDVVDVLWITDPDQSSDELRQSPISTGPYVLTESQPGVQYTFTRNPYYWLPDYPVADSIIVRVVPTLQTQLVELETGSADLLLGALPDLPAVNAANGVVAEPLEPASSHFSLIVNTREGPLADRRVRQAVNAALDRDAIVASALFGGSENRCLPWADGNPAFTPEGRNCPQDLSLARQLLADAGVGQGLSLEILAFHSTQPVAEVVQANLQQAGIDASVVVLEDAAVIERVRSDRDFDIAAWAFSRSARDPATLISAAVPFVPGPESPSGIQSPEYDAVWQELQTTVDPDRRAELYGELNRVLLSESFHITLAPNPFFAVHREGWGGFQSDLENLMILEGANFTP